MIFRSIYTLIKKDMTIFFRSKISAIFVLIIPLLIILLAGYSFNSTSLSNVNIGIYSGSNSNFSDNIISKFEGVGFIYLDYNSTSECVNSIKDTKSQICIVFPDKLKINATNDDIVFYVDYSRMNLADTLVNDVKLSVSSEASNMGLVVVNDLIDVIGEAKKTTPINKKYIEDIIILENKNSENIKNLNFPYSKISETINKLEILNKNINVNDTSSIKKVEETILLLKSIKDDGDKFTADIGLVSETQINTILKLNEALEKISKLNNFLNSKDIETAENIVNPIKTKILPINPDSKSRDYLIPTLLALIAMFGSILFSSTLVLKSKKTLAFFRNFMTPVKSVVFLISTYLSSLFILFIQFALVFIGLRYILKINIFVMPLEMSIVLFLSLTTFIFIGIFIGYLFRSDEAVIFSAMIISTLFMFFSNIILPLENISSELMRFAVLNPLVVSNLALKKVILFGFSFSQLKEDFLILGIFIIVFFILSLIFRNTTRRIL